jgi:8-oxo-dGTP pyrophosphatase MutT (NUDIX family)
MKKVNVVTAFLTNEGKILILRRSDKVRTMKGKWAGISGYIEGEEDALERAYREIQEETSITSNELQLVKAAKPLEVPDPETDTLWIVHPHLLRTRQTVIRLDWEHDSYRWIEPHEITNYDTVPMLKETLYSVVE